MKKYDAIVIGSGIGGLAAALLMAHGGKKVAVLEKNAVPGGRLSSDMKDGFMLDLGVHCISQGDVGPVGACLRRCGVKQDMEFTKVRPLLTYEGQEPLKFPMGLQGKIPDADFMGLMNFMGDMKKMTEEDFASFDEMTAEEYLNRYTKNEVVHSLVNMLGLVYCVVPSWELSAGELMRCLYREAASHASGYPEGGCISITNNYIKGIEQYGGEIIYSAPAEKIIIEGGKAVGVIAGGEEYRAEYIVSNADIKNTIFNLVGEDQFDEEYIEYIKGLKYAWGGYLVKFALDQPITDIKMMSMSVLNPKEYYSGAEEGIVPENVQLFIVVPSNFSPTVCPEGKQLVIVGSPFQTDLPDEFFEKLEKNMIKNIEQYIPGLMDHVEWIERVNPSRMGERTGEFGNIIGIAQIPGQTGAKRPSIKSPIEGLYFVGGEAGGSGVGIELCINSAEEFYDNYCK